MFGTIVIDLNPNVAQIGPVLITWHGIFSVIGIVAAARVGQMLLQRDGIAPDRVYDMAVWMVVAGLIGARLLFVWENYQQFEGNLIRIVQINEGGISQWGGIFGALIGGYAWCRHSGVDFRKILDAAGPANALGFAIGRIGDVINGEHHAIPTNLPWGVQYVNEQTLGEVALTVHPEVAYELVFNLLVFVAAIATYPVFKRRLPTGVTGLIWLSVYATGRFFLSFLREDSLIFGLRQAQWASLLMIAVSIVAIVVWTRWSGRRTPAEAEAESGQEPAAV